MALNTNALVSLADFKAFVKVPTAETSMDALLEGFINSVSQRIETYCRRKFRQLTHTEHHDGGRVNLVLLRQWPVNTVTSLHCSSERVWDSTSLIAATNYQIVKDEQGEGIAIERFDGTFPNGQKNIQVVYIAGYSALSDVPADLQLAAKIAAAFWYIKQQNMDWTQSTVAKGDENITIVQGIPKDARELLEDYRRMEGALDGPVRNY